MVLSMFRPCVIGCYVDVWSSCGVDVGLWSVCVVGVGGCVSDLSCCLRWSRRCLLICLLNLDR